MPSVASRWTAALVALALALALPVPVGGDALDDALALAGWERSDLGWRPRGYWSRYPAAIPYKLRHFDDILAEPLAVVPFARTAASVVRAQLDPAALAKPAEKSDGALFQAVLWLGVERKFGGFRGYSANLEAKPSPLADALLAAQTAGRRQTSFVTFGQASPYPDLRKELDALVQPVPEAARPALGRLVLNLLDARAWVERAFRNVPEEARLAVQRRLDLGVELTDALEYSPELDDVAAGIDEASLWYGGLKATAALEQARHDLAGLAPAPPFRLDWPTPFGWVRIRGGGDDEIDADDAFLVVDLGGNDRWRGGAAAPAPGRHLSAALDLAGNDAYTARQGPAQGAGLGGVGVLLDVAGDDRYQAETCAQGFGQVGLGVLADLAGRDEYRSRYSSQGSALLGVGLLLEAAGDDTYRVESDGQGFGGAGGVGTLADRSGNDRYEAVRDPAVTGRPSYHSQLKVAVSNSQGVGLGLRGDGGDGHSWAGGLGQLLDEAGDDEYVAGNWSMGTGYWFGTGILHDGGGNDVYRGVWWSQGSGAHFCIGALVDEGGNDRHLVEEKGANSLAFGHDFTVALLADLGGDDVYETEADGLGFSINRSFAFLIDVGGNDAYRAPEKVRPGFARFDPKLTDRSASSTYFADASSLGLFLDVGGQDTYRAGAGGDDRTWLDEPGSANLAARNASIGVDRTAGEVNLDPLPERRPGAARRKAPVPAP